MLVTIQDVLRGGSYCLSEYSQSIWSETIEKLIESFKGLNIILKKLKTSRELAA